MVISHGKSRIARTLQETRADLGLSQRELSQRSGLTQAQISRIENGAVDMRISSLLALTKELGLELSFAHQKPPPRPVARGEDFRRRRVAQGKAALGLVDAPRRGIFRDIEEELL